ncbi:uncharacterized protein [Malus domestica]|uniref:uncharacterized protein n=1 Tax=Malus domestica TaxID=3750 RepID=UPI0039757574
MVSDVVGQTGSEVRGEVLDGGINNGDIDIPDLNEEVEPEVSREEFLECNFDGAWNQREQWGGYGVVIRDHWGNFLAATVGPIVRPTDALDVEFIAARQSVLLVKDVYMANVKIQFEGDASLVLIAMKGKGDDSSALSPIINDLRCLLQEWPNSMISHVQREGNSVAHQLARLGIASAQKVVWFKEPPDLIQDVLFE